MHFATHQSVWQFSKRWKYKRFTVAQIEYSKNNESDCIWLSLEWILNVISLKAFGTEIDELK